MVGLRLSSTEPYSLYPPCVTACCNRPVIGIVTQIDHPDGDPDRAQGWLELAGCHPIFRVSSYTGEGIWTPANSLGKNRSAPAAGETAVGALLL